MKDISSRKDIYIVVSSFYSNIKKNKSIGYIFTQAIPDSKWEPHMQKITDFWDSAIFGSMTYKGNPPMKHVELDKTHQYAIGKEHFQEWLKEWEKNIDHLFAGPRALDMKLRATKMANGLYLSISNSKPKI